MLDLEKTYKLLLLFILAVLINCPMVFAQELTEEAEETITCKVTLHDLTKGTNEKSTLYYSDHFGNGVYYWDKMTEEREQLDETKYDDSVPIDNPPRKIVLYETRLHYTFSQNHVTSIAVFQGPIGHSGSLVLTALCDNYGCISSIVLSNGSTVKCDYNDKHQLVKWTFNQEDLEYVVLYTWNAEGDLITAEGRSGGYSYITNYSYSTNRAFYMGLEYGIYPFYAMTGEPYSFVSSLFVTGAIGARPIHELKGFSENSSYGHKVTYKYDYDGYRVSSIRISSKFEELIGEDSDGIAVFQWQ